MSERELKLPSGYVGIAVELALFAGGIASIWYGALTMQPFPVWFGIALLVLWLFGLFGFIVNGPNMTRVVQLFGTYKGTVRDVGFFYGNPFYWRTKVSMKVRTFETGVEKTDDVKDATG